MERFLSLWVEIPNSEGRMKYEQCWKEKVFLFTNGKRHLCVYLLLSSFYTPSPCMNTLDQTYYLAHYLFFPIFKKFGHQKVCFSYNHVFYCSFATPPAKKEKFIATALGLTYLCTALHILPLMLFQPLVKY